ncbi:MAG: hypothetical protein ABEI98_08490 [Halorhabdus sp.]
MDRSRKALASLLAADEELLESWTVDTINEGFELSPPGMGPDETLGLTERRLIWLDEDLESVDLDDVLVVSGESVSESASPVLATGGILALVLGIVATPALWVLTSLPIAQTIAPLVGGVILFGLATIASHLRTGDDGGNRQHYLEVKTARTTVQVYASEDTVTEMAERIESHRE